MHGILGQKSVLGSAVRKHRRSRRETQATVARRVEISVAAVRSVERGEERISSFSAVLEALNLELRGRSLIAGPIGPALAAACKTRRVSRREIARALQMSRNTLAAVEAGTGTMAALEAYASALAAGLHLASPEEPRGFFTFAGNSSTHHGWETPQALAGNLTRAVGGFDLDPCAATADRRRARVKARLLLTAEDDGLAVSWRGRIFVNPPYGRSIKLWVAKCAAEAATGLAMVVALIPARPDSGWWHENVAGRADVFMLKGRLKFAIRHRQPHSLPSSRYGVRHLQLWWH